MPNHSDGDFRLRFLGLGRTATEIQIPIEIQVFSDGWVDSKLESGFLCSDILLALKDEGSRLSQDKPSTDGAHVFGRPKGIG
jgi:hypothetical protein